MTEQKTSEPSDRAFTSKAHLLAVVRHGVRIEWVQQMWPRLCGWYVDTMDATRALIDLEGPNRAMVIRTADDPISRAALEALLPPWPDAQDGSVEFFDRCELAAMVAEKHPPLRDAIAFYDEGPIIVIRQGIVAVFPVPPHDVKTAKVRAMAVTELPSDAAAVAQ